MWWHFRRMTSVWGELWIGFQVARIERRGTEATERERKTQGRISSTLTVCQNGSTTHISDNLQKGLAAQVQGAGADAAMLGPRALFSSGKVGVVALGRCRRIQTLERVVLVVTIQYSWRLSPFQFNICNARIARSIAARNSAQSGFKLALQMLVCSVARPLLLRMVETASSSVRATVQGSARSRNQEARECPLHLLCLFATREGAKHCPANTCSSSLVGTLSLASAECVDKLVTPTRPDELPTCRTVRLRHEHASQSA